MDALVEGLRFFTAFHTAAQGLGPLNNQRACLGCHLNAADAVSSPGLLQGLNCNRTPPSVSSTCSNVSNVTRAGRSTPTNFEITSLNPATGGGAAPDILVTPDTFDVDPGKTAAFTTFGDFDPCPMVTNALTGLPGGCDAASNPTGIGFFDPLDGATENILTNKTAQPFGGLVQHHWPAGPDCITKPLPPVRFDADLNGTLVPSVGISTAASDSGQARPISAAGSSRPYRPPTSRQTR
jgi:hypothetical protein